MALTGSGDRVGRRGSAGGRYRIGMCDRRDGLVFQGDVGGRFAGRFRFANELVADFIAAIGTGLFRGRVGGLIASQALVRVVRFVVRGRGDLGGGR